MNIDQWLIHSEIAYAIGWMVIHSLWISTGIALITFVLLRSLRRQSASMRYWIGLLGLMGMALIPLMFTWQTAAITDPANTTKPSGSERPGLLAKPTAVTPQTFDIEGQAPIESTVPASEPLPDMARAWMDRALPWVSFAWAIGVVLLLIKNLGGWYTTRRLTQVGCQPVNTDMNELLGQVAERMEVRHAVRVVQSTLVQVPMVIGMIKPVILLPVHLIERLTQSQIRLVIAHELAHVRRFDYLVNVIQTLVDTLFFYHPAFWCLSAEIRKEREHVCDDLAAHACGSGLQLADAILAVETFRAERHAAMAMSFGGGDTRQRVQRLIGHGTPSKNLAGQVLVGLTMLCISLLGANEFAASQNSINLQGKNTTPLWRLISGTKGYGRFAAKQFDAKSISMDFATGEWEELNHFPGRPAPVNPALDGFDLPEGAKDLRISQSGQWLAYSMPEGESPGGKGPGRVSLHIQSKGASGSRMLLPASDIREYVWSPDGQWLACSYDGKLEMIHLTDAEKNISLPHTDLDSEFYAHAATHLLWRPDSQALAFRTLFLGGRDFSSGDSSEGVPGDVELFQYDFNLGETQMITFPQALVDDPYTSLMPLKWEMVSRGGQQGVVQTDF